MKTRTLTLNQINIDINRDWDSIYWDSIYRVDYNKTNFRQDGDKYFSKILGAFVAPFSIDIDFINTAGWGMEPICSRCAYKKLCQNFNSATLTYLEGLDCDSNNIHYYKTIETIYPVEELHKILFKINNSYIEYTQEKLELMELLINVEYLTNNNLSGGTRGI